MNEAEARVVKLENVEEGQPERFEFQCGPVHFPASADPINGAVDMVNELNKMGENAFTSIANSCGIPFQLDKLDKLRPLIMGIVQNAWHITLKGAVPERMMTRHVDRIKAYTELMGKVQEATKTRVEKAKVTKASKPRPEKKEKPAKVAAPKEPKKYQLVETKATKDKWFAFTKQKKVIIDAMQKFPDGATPEQIVSKCKGKFEGSKQSEEKIVGFYIGDFKRAGIIKEVK